MSSNLTPETVASVPIVLAPHGNLSHLWAQAVQTPGEDSVRFAFRDALEETADDWASGSDEARQSLRDWAEFFRLQYRLEEIGPPRLRIENDATIVARGGPDYFTCDVAEGVEIKPGDRIDLVTHKTWAKAQRLMKRSESTVEALYHGLKVVKVERRGAFGPKLVLERDELSVPYPQKEVDTAVGGCRGLCARNACWGISKEIQEVYMPDCLISANLMWRKGLPSVLMFSSWSHLSSLTETLPIAEVLLLRPRVDWSWSAHHEHATYFLRGSPAAALRMIQRSAKSYAEAEEHARDPGLCERLLRLNWPTVTNWHFPK